MASRSSLRRKALLVALGMVASIGGVTLVLAWTRPFWAATFLPVRGFREAATQSGLDFHMTFLSDEQGEHFKINLYDHGSGVVVGDYDGDGRDDVLFLNELGPNALYHNLGDGRFANVTAENPAVALDDRVCVGGTFADYDNDGDQDLYITSTRGGNVLLENQGSDGFCDVTERAGVACVAHSQTPAFFDYDNDGRLDLLVTNTAEWTTNQYDPETKHYIGPEKLSQNVRALEYNLLFHNNGDGTFSEVAEQTGARGSGWSGDVAVFDYDGDGDLDMFVTNMFGRCQLLNNGGQGQFSDVTNDALKWTSFGSIGCKAFDYDNDGLLDLFVADMHSDMWASYHDEQLIEPTRKFPHFWGPKALRDFEGMRLEANAAMLFRLDYDRMLFGNTLYHNDGDGSFSEVSNQSNIETFWPWGVATGDFDNDGHVDVYLPSGMGYPYFYHPSSLMMNGGDGTFHDEAARRGIEPPAEGPYLARPIGGKQAARSERCAAVADFDGDGRLDLVVNNFNDRPFFFRNEFPAANFVEIRLVGTRSNRDAIGATVRLECGDEILVRQVQCAGGYLSQSSKTLHFGLGNIAQIDRAEIRWPSGGTQMLQLPDINKLYEIREDDTSG